MTAPTLPPPIPKTGHPRPWWCPQCGALECPWHYAGRPRPLSAPAPVPIPRTRETVGIRRHRRYLTALARIGGAS